MTDEKFYYETHLHTCESSRCGVSSGQDMAHHHKQLGFSGIFVTDHFVTGNSHGNIDAPWNQRIDALYAGYLKAKREGAQCGLDVFFAFEYLYEYGDYLTYGLDVDFLYKHPELADFEGKSDFEGYSRLVHENGGMIVQAHPYREGFYTPSGRAPMQEKHIDAIEVFNGSHKNPRFNENALEKARQLNMPMTAGSDTHRVAMSGTAYMAFDHHLKDAQDFIAQVRKKNYTLIQKESCP